MSDAHEFIEVTSDTMTLRDLGSRLEAAFHAPAAAGMDAVLRIQVGDEHITFRVAHGTLSVLDDPLHAPDATFHFADLATASALFSGTEDAFEAFMNERFRADGYLMWAFTLIAMFRSRSLPVTPVE
ncbi:MAG: SCP2 sterol-binding domain-containing protein [Pseudomonadales bacterium]|nr:SCP2 sterol-binding domain-containing protein [Pseudomonadales bacterium]